MLDQILWVNALICLAAGAALILVPKITIRALGLPATMQYFYVRLFGAALIGIALSIIIERASVHSIGLGAGGAIALNFTAAITLALQLMLVRTGMTVRGRILLWALVFILGFIGFVLIAYT